MIRSRELSAAELLEAGLARIEAVNPAVNAIGGPRLVRRPAARPGPKRGHMGLVAHRPR
jgi:Asp-tRNA(Asn)/Glu-tRNA(Gln) amidotransferase A subunit family amidase